LIGAIATPHAPDGPESDRPVDGVKARRRDRRHASTISARLSDEVDRADCIDPLGPRPRQRRRGWPGRGEMSRAARGRTVHPLAKTS
jgi:hypothetical protein